MPTYSHYDAPASAGGGGTVTSVAFTAPTGFGITGSPITTAGTIALSLNSQAANLFLASPSGGSGVPSFRAITTADIPSGANGFFKDGGNSFGHTAILGTIDNQQLNFNTNNTQKAAITPGGEFLIGTNTATGGTTKLTVNGNINTTSQTFGTTNGLFVSGTTLSSRNAANTADRDFSAGSVSSSGGFFGPVLSSPTSANGLFTLGTATTSNTTSRNIADAVATATANNINASSTGHIFDFQSASVTQAFVDKSGTGNFPILQTSQIQNAASSNLGRFLFSNGTNKLVWATNDNNADAALYINKQQGTGTIFHVANNGTDVFNIQMNGNTSIGNASTPTAKLMLGAGTATAGTAPLKLISGTVLTTVEDGAIEYNGTNYFASVSTTRYTLAKTLTTTASLTFGSVNAGSSVDLTVALTGAVLGDIVSLGIPNATMAIPSTLFIAWVSAADTISIRAANIDPISAISISTGTFRVSLTKY